MQFASKACKSGLPGQALPAFQAGGITPAYEVFITKKILKTLYSSIYKERFHNKIFFKPRKLSKSVEICLELCFDFFIIIKSGFVWVKIK